MRIILLLIGCGYYMSGCGRFNKKLKKSAAAKQLTTAKEVDLIDLPEEYLHSTQGVRGLTNMGFTCYFNAVMQVLTHTTSFWNYFKQLEDGIPKEVDSIEANVVNRVLHLFKQQWEAADRHLGKPITPKALFQSFRDADVAREQQGDIARSIFVIGRQEDGQEASQRILETLENAIGKLISDEVIDIDPLDIHIFSMTSYKHLSKDVIEQSTTNTQSLLMVPLAESQSTLDLDVGKVFRGDPRMGVTCEDGEKHDVWVKDRLNSFPQVLLVLAQRTSFVGGVRTKNQSPIRASLDLVLSGIEAGEIATNVHYKLVGIVYHIGNSPDEGHYTASFLHPIKNKWFYANDSKISLHKNNTPYLTSNQGFFYVYEKQIDKVEN